MINLVEHDFTGNFDRCKGCGKYVEQLINERYCSMSKKKATKHPDADTSPERLAEIKAFFTHLTSAHLTTIQKNAYERLRDLLAMIEERTKFTDEELARGRETPVLKSTASTVLTFTIALYGDKVEIEKDAALLQDAIGGIHTYECVRRSHCHHTRLLIGRNEINEVSK